MKKITLSGFQLKLLALFGMVVDHVNTHFGQDLHLPLWTSFVGRFVAPIFLYLLMEGFLHTRNRKAYFKRLASGAVIMALINMTNNLLTGQYLNPFTKEFDVYYLLNGNNIFLTLTCFFMVFTIVQKWRQNEGSRWLNSFYLLGLILVTCLTEGGLYLLPLGLVFALTKNNKQWAIGTILLTSVLLFGKAIFNFTDFGYQFQTFYQYISFDNQFMWFPAAILIWLYNGKRGGNGEPWEKNLFYWFYPAHLALIYMIEGLLG